MPSDSNTGEAARTGWKFWAPLVVVCVAMFIVVVDSTMMNVAVPTIVKDLRTNVSAVQGVIAFYSLVMASLMLVGGKLGGIHGVKRVFVIGLIIYGVGTLLAAVSWNVTVLAIGWSLLEGIGAAMILPLAFTLIVVNYEPRAQVIGFGILAGVQASAAAVGPILGGILTTYASWRWGFAGEALIAVLALIFTRSVRESVTADERTTLDWVGALLSVLGLLLLVLGLIMAGRYGWWLARRPFVVAGIPLNPLGLSPTPFLVGLGLVFLVAFIHWQLHRERQGKTPLVRLRILENGQFLSGVAINIVQSLIITGILFVLPLYLQSAVGYTAFWSGLAILPFSMSTFVVSLGTAGWGERIAPRHLIQVGIVLLAAGVWLLERTISLSITVTQMIVPMGIFGMGMGLLMAQLVNLILSAVAPEDSPEASGINNAMNELGNSLGTAVVGSLLMAYYLGSVADGILRTANIAMTETERSAFIVELENLGETATPDEKQAYIAALPEAVQERMGSIFDSSMVSAMRDTLSVIFFLSLLTLLLSTFLPKKPHRLST